MRDSIFNISNNKYFLLFCLLCFSFISTFFTSRFSLLYGDFNPWSDINIYYTIGKGIFFDMIPYKDIFDHKGPLIFFIYYLGYLITPNSFQGIFIIEVLFLFTQLLFIYKLARLFLPQLFSILTPIIFTPFFYQYTGDAGSAEQFILTFIIIGLYYFTQYFCSPIIKHNPKLMLIHGALLAIVFFIKLNLVCFWFFPLLFIFFYLIYHKEYKNAFQNLIYCIIGILVITGSIFIYFLLNNALIDFWNGYFLINLAYGKIESINSESIISSYFYRSVTHIKSLINNDLYNPFLLLTGLFICILFNKKKRFFILSFILTVVLQFLSTISGNVITFYYFLIYLTFTPLGLIVILYGINNLLKNKVKLQYTFFVCISILAFYFILKSKNFYNNTIEDLMSHNIRAKMVQNTGLNNFTNYLNTKENNDFLCLGLNSHIDLYYLMNKVPKVKYFFTPNISYSQYPTLIDEQKDYIRNKKINFIFLADTFPLKILYIDLLEENGYRAVLYNEKTGITLYGLTK